jgi:hypothetical protein
MATSSSHGDPSCRMCVSRSRALVCSVTAQILKNMQQPSCPVCMRLSPLLAINVLPN